MSEVFSSADIFIWLHGRPILGHSLSWLKTDGEHFAMLGALTNYLTFDWFFLFVLILQFIYDCDNLICLNERTSEGLYF